MTPEREDPVRAFTKLYGMDDIWTGIDRLRAQLERDRTKVAECITMANRELDSRQWLTEGRGSYEWDDDRYREEFLTAGIAIKEALKPLKKIAADWTDCPQTSAEVAAARSEVTP